MTTLRPSRWSAGLAVAVLLLAGCGGDDGSSDAELARDSLLATGLSETELDCVLEQTDLSELEVLEIDTDASPEFLDAFAACVDAEGDDGDGAASDPVDDQVPDDDAAAGDAADRALVVESGLSEDEIDCILESTEFTLADLVALAEGDTMADGTTPSADQDAAIAACFGAGAEGGEPVAEDDSDAATQEEISASTFTGDCTTVDGPCSFGDDADLDRLWEGCAAGNGFFCDQLYADSPVGSEYEHFGNTCGERTVEASCTETYGSG